MKTLLVSTAYLFSASLIALISPPSLDFDNIGERLENFVSSIGEDETTGDEVVSNSDSITYKKAEISKPFQVRNVIKLSNKTKP